MLKNFQKALRASETDAEHRLWYYLRDRGINGFKFRRQHILQGYIVDFVCLEKKLIIELDGAQHMEQKTYDEIRTEKLTCDGFHVIRFWNDEVLNNISMVLEIIYNMLDEIQEPLNPLNPLTRRKRRGDLSHKGRGKKTELK